jgi:ABC-2 type transport system permease protein
MIVTKLVAVEWLKTSRRFGFWMGMLFFVGLLAVGFGADYYNHVTNAARRTGAAQWGNAVDASTSIGFLVLLALIVLLSASEKTWRTERQNVIDGLSRSQYFAGKAILVVMLSALVWLIALTFGGVFTVLERGLVDSPTREFIDRIDLRMLAGLLLYLTVVGCIALFFGTVASSSGAALALAILFLMIQPMIMMVMARSGGAWLEATAYLPMQVLSSLTSRTTHDPELFARMQERMPEGMPRTLMAGRATIVAAIYAALFALGAWLSIRTRDL